MPDGWEVQHSLNPTSDDSAGDSDADALTNLEEYQLGTDPQNSDTDGDGMPDGAEIANLLNPLNPDSDGDLLLDGADPLPRVHNGIVILTAVACTITAVLAVLLILTKTGKVKLNLNLQWLKLSIKKLRKQEKRG